MLSACKKLASYMIYACHWQCVSGCRRAALLLHRQVRKTAGGEEWCHV